MTIEIWLAFAVTSTVMLSIPGPTVVLIVSDIVGKGARTAWATAPGVVLGDFSAMTISLAGAGALLAASSTLFTIMKLIGAAYLIWLGVKLWRSTPSLSVMAAIPNTQDNKKMFWNSYIVTALNPKSIVFFIAFVPQFVDASKPLLLQFAILEATFLMLAALNIMVWALLVGKMRRLFARPKILARLNKAGGGFLIGAGVLTAAARN
jgi:homoserine/homoserine lactone efflux protein